MILKNNAFLLLIISLLFSVIFPFNSLKANPDHFHKEDEMKVMDEMKMNHDHNHNHNHNSLDVSDHSPLPVIEVKVYPDRVKGWNLKIQTSNFAFTPENLGNGSNPNQGHAHLYVNGKKVTRIYSNWYYISELPQGENEIKVTLNTDNHQDLVYQGQIISDSIIINHK